MLTIKKAYANIGLDEIEVKILIFKIKKGRRNVRDFIVCCILVIAIYSDYTSYKVKNSIIWSGLSIGIIVQFFYNGLDGIFQWFLGISLPICLLWFLFRYRMLGAGDIKLFSVIGGLYGPLAVINIIILAFLAGGLLSIIRLIQVRNFKSRLQYLAVYIQNQYEKTGIEKYYIKERDGTKMTIHFAVAIGIGVFVYRFGHITII